MSPADAGLCTLHCQPLAGSRRLTEGRGRVRRQSNTRVVARPLQESPARAAWRVAF